MDRGRVRGSGSCEGQRRLGVSSPSFETASRDRAMLEADSVARARGHRDEARPLNSSQGERPMLEQLIRGLMATLVLVAACSWAATSGAIGPSATDPGAQVQNGEDEAPEPPAGVVPPPQDLTDRDLSDQDLPSEELPDQDLSDQDLPSGDLPEGGDL